MNQSSLRVAAPAPPPQSAPYSFPLIATLTPVFVSLGLWLATRSVFALVFAVLGPAVALGSLADARLQSRRRRRRELAEYRRELEAAHLQLAAAHERERRALDAAVPSASAIVEPDWPAAEYWTRTDATAQVTLGRGRRTSAVEVDGAGPPGVGGSPGRETDRRLERDLVDAARELPDAPVVVDARLGIGLVGSGVVAAAAARAIVVQLAAVLSPATHAVVIDAAGGRELDGWSWARRLPHADDPPGSLADSDPGSRVRFVERSTGESLAVSVAPHRSALRGAPRVVLDVGGGEATVVQHPDREFAAQAGPVSLDLVTAELAGIWASSVAVEARRLGLAAVEGQLPELARFAECVSANGVHPRPRGLECSPALGAAGPVPLDLVAHGPHAVVGGTTGSGKSELLIAWVLAMAAAHSPRELSVLLVDFKGGSSFASLEVLPHCVGMISDLDGSSARRALESLAAELRRRERHLADARSRAIDELSGDARLPRLVIVVDEFAAMVAGFPELHALFSDIAARGRSLGVHLILCTQRPAGVIRDAVLANSALRISLRVNNRADSTAVIGTDAAAVLPPHSKGRAYVVTDGGDPQLAQFALVTAADVDTVAQSWAHDTYRPHRPWLDPLPAVVPVEHLPAGDADTIPFGVLDRPEAQSQPVAAYRPAVHGNLLVVGAAGAGKSAFVDTIVRGGRALRLPSSVEGAWDALAATLEALRSDAAPQSAALLVIDDVDVLVSRYSEDYEGAVLELIARVMREGPARGIRCVLTAQRLTPALHSLAALCGSRLLLRLPNRQEHVLAGGDGAGFESALPPGAGVWQGLRVQVAFAGDSAREGAAPGGADSGGVYSGGADAAGASFGGCTILDGTGPLAVVTPHAGRFAERLRDSFDGLRSPGAITGVATLAGPTLAGPTLAGPPLAGPPLAGLHPAAGEISVTVGRHPTAIVGDSDEWQAQWGALTGLRSTHTIVIDGYSVAEFRTLTRSRALPPPLGSSPGVFWALSPTGEVRRARLPDASG